MLRIQWISRNSRRLRSDQAKDVPLAMTGNHDEVRAWLKENAWQPPPKNRVTFGSI
jgi:hypothetical protein